MDITTRDQARIAIEEAGITSSNVTKEQLSALKKHINMRMKASGNYRGTFKMDRSVGLFMTCSTDQWKGREAVSFNRDGFVGLAGWADENNIKPILQGIEDWLTKGGE